MTTTFKLKDVEVLVTDPSFSGIYTNGVGAANTMYEEYKKRVILLIVNSMQMSLIDLLLSLNCLKNTPKKRKQLTIKF